MSEFEIDADAVVAAYHKPRERFVSGSMPEERQLINVFLEKVRIYPGFIEVYIKNIPDHLHKDKNHDAVKLTGNIGAFEVSGDATAANHNENNNIEHIENIQLFPEKSYFGTGSRTSIDNEKSESCDEQDSAKACGVEGNRFSFSFAQPREN